MLNIGNERLSSIFRFLEVCDALKTTYRAAYLQDESRRESTAEHVWHACLLAMLLHRDSGRETDIGKVLQLLIVHDLVEVYAGDAALHDESLRVAKKEKERDAAEKLYGQLPDDMRGEFQSLWEEFEAGESPEARYAMEIDRIQAIAQNIFARGRTWADYRVTEKLARERNLRALGFDPVLAEVFEYLYERATSEGLWHAE